jgi:ketopantoate reductase
MAHDMELGCARNTTYTTVMAFVQPKQKLNVLLIGSGAVGSVFGAQLALSGQNVWIYAHSEHDRVVARNGLKVHDTTSGTTETAIVKLAANPTDRCYDLVLVVVRADQLGSVYTALMPLTGSPHIMFLGNNPDGYKKIPKHLPGTTELGFPGIGADMYDDGVEYVRIPQQPTTLEVNSSEVSKVFETVLRSRGFSVTRIADIDGWLAYHSVFIGNPNST